MEVKVIGNETEGSEAPNTEGQKGNENSVGSSKTCVICGKSEAPYKCPTCFAKYCSVGCCKTHKTDPSCAPPRPPKTDNEEEDKADGSNTSSSSRIKKYSYPTEDTVPLEKLQMLAEGENLVQLRKFLEEPTVRSDILKLDRCTDPVSTFGEVMEDERFVQFSAFVTNELNKSERENLRRILDEDE